ncbi:MAG: glycosyltransferase family 2 protein [Actinobacteria bacterium]|nr:glycosyltransferase family 2 protein [Actinomycetota bacterium]
MPSKGLLSLITAIRKGREDYLFAETAKSLLEQRLPTGWALEWLIQEDGDDPALEDIVKKFTLGDKRIQYEASGTALGPGGTRTLALWRARGELVRTLDSDDLLLPGALAAQINIFTTYPDIQWSVTQPSELLPDNSQIPYRSTLAFGAVLPGSLNRNMAEYGRCPVHCAGLMMRADAALAFGGWMGLPVGEDVGLLAAISEIFTGWHDPTVTWLYRRHHTQTTRTVLHPFWRTLGETVGAQRSAAINRLGLMVASASDSTAESCLVLDTREAESSSA